jgi:DNA-binding CsgD family transcriptional regulator
VWEGLERVRAAAASAELALDDGLEPEYAVHAAHVLAWVGEFRRARLLLDRVLLAARKSGALGVLPWALYVASDLGIRTGHWPQARADAWEATRVAEEAGNEFLRAYALGCLAVLDAGQGRDAECAAHAAQAESIAARLDVECPRKVSDARGLLALGLGRPTEAIAHFRHAGVVGTRMSLPDLVEAYVRAQLTVPDDVRTCVAALPTGDPLVRAMVDRCRGLMSAGAEFETHFQHAIAACDEAWLPFARARTALLLGERLRRAGRRADARAALRAAADGFRRLEAIPWIERAEGELRATGETVQRRPRDEDEQLTAQELQVALVVARGATNREAGAALFLSPKTIEYHLGRVYRKLGVRSRTELSRRLDDPAVPAPLSAPV